MGTGCKPRPRCGARQRDLGMVNLTEPVGLPAHFGTQTWRRNMADKGKKDTGKREKKTIPKLTAKEKRKLKKEKSK